MSVIDKIQERLDKNLYTVSVFGSREAVYEQMWDDIESLLILFCAQKSVKEAIIEDILNWADNITDCWWLDSPNKGGYDFEKLRKLL